MTIEKLQYQGAKIPRRVDGYFNATAMCQAGGKDWSGWRRLQSTDDLLDALAETLQICREYLVESTEGRKGGTWVHPHVAIALAQWISPAFHAWCIGVVMERVEPARPAALPIPAGEVEQVQVRIDGNKAVAASAEIAGAPYAIVHDQKNLALTGKRTKHWKEVTGHDKWLECCSTQDQAIMGVGSMGYANRMAQAASTGLVGMEVLPHANEWGRRFRELMGQAVSPGVPWSPAPGRSRVNQLGTVKNRRKRLEAQKQQPLLPGL